MATDISAVDQQLGNRLVGDLHSTPDAARKFVDQDIYALEWALGFALPSEKSWMEGMIKERRAQLESELAQSNVFLTTMLQTQVNHQLRSRPDFATGKIAVEQWVPALRCWLVNGLFDPTTPALEIIRVLQAGDPTRRTAEEEIAEKRTEAEAQRVRNEKAGDQKVADVVASLSNERVQNFVDVERALQTGENITVRGDDRRTIERLTEGTEKAARQGDQEAQQVIERGGVADDRTCILPTTNPFRHRHRKELEGGPNGRSKS